MLYPYFIKMNRTILLIIMYKLPFKKLGIVIMMTQLHVEYLYIDY